MPFSIEARASFNNTVSKRAKALFQENQVGIYQRTDRLFAYLMALQWIAGIVTAFWISPRTWLGTYSEIHLHLWASIIVGGMVSIFPIGLAILRPGTKLTRHVIAGSQMLTTALFVHLSGGRIETHFMIFGSLAFLACYRDWRVLITATIVVSIDHVTRGIFFPQSVFGTISASPWRVFEHSAWVVFEDIFLIITILQSLREMKKMALQRAELEETNNIVEAEVEIRTRDLQDSHIAISEANTRLVQQAAERDIQANLLREANRKAKELSAFGQILDRSLNEIYIFDAHSLRFIHVNHGAQDNIGYTLKELQEMTPIDLKSSHTIEAFAKIVAPLNDGINGSIDFRSSHRRKDGSEYPVEVHLEKSTFADRSVFVANIVDITERVKIDKELEESKERALTADRTKSEFLANMSHEIRTPMTAILGFSDVLLNEEGIEHAPPARIEAFQTIQRNGKYLLEIINDILDISKIESGKLEVEQIEFSPSEVLSEVLKLMKVRSNAKGLPFEITYDGLIPQKIKSDPTRLRQILINLAGNAIKFTEVGKVQIIARVLDADSDYPRMQFDVVDSGIGMTEEQLSRLFQPFVQADTSTTREFGGTGLGLTISKRLAEMLGGDIHVQSTSGEGSVFSATISTGALNGVSMVDGQIKKEASKKTLKNPDKNALQNRRILLAEDGPDNQRLISLVLRKAGADVTVAENGQIALDLALEAYGNGTPFHVILMDMQMPVLDGYGATQKLREADYTLPIIALTAHAMSGNRKKCIAAGCDDYLTKPIDRMILVSTVANYVSKEESSPITE